MYLLPFFTYFLAWLIFFNYFMAHAKRISIHRNNSQPFTINGLAYISSTKLVGKYRLYISMYVSIYVSIYVYIYIPDWKNPENQDFWPWKKLRTHWPRNLIFFWCVMLVSRCSKFFFKFLRYSEHGFPEAWKWRFWPFLSYCMLYKLASLKMWNFL